MKGCDRIPRISEENWSKHLTLPGKISFSVTLDQIEKALFFPKLSKLEDFL
jgi:hypothetical protein